MRLLLINPNSTASMTALIARAARSVAGQGTLIEAVNPLASPASIEGHVDEVLCAPGILAEVTRGEAIGIDAYVIACFDDPALGAARELARGPVLGICEAGVHAATMLAARFSVVTTLARSVPIIEDLVHAYCGDRRCRSVRAVDIPVLALEADPLAARARIAAEIRQAVTVDRAEVIVLGCAGMSEHCGWLEQETGVPVIDGIKTAVAFAEGLVRAGYRTSKHGAYATPLLKEPAAHRLAMEHAGQ